MHIKNYLDGLEEKNGYCTCPEMQTLYSLRKKAEILEDRKSINSYYAQLSKKEHSQSLVFFLHNSEEELKEIGFKEIQKGDSITIHCRICNQQFDIMDN